MGGGLFKDIIGFISGAAGERVPEPPEPERVPTREEVKTPASKTARDARALKLRKATGHRGNIRTSPLGVEGEPLSALSRLFNTV